MTAEEIAHYREFGWVKLSGFVDPAIVRTLLDIARQRMGEDGDSNAAYGLNQPYFNAEYGGGLAIPPIRALLEGVGRNAKALMARKAGSGVRYFTDFFAPKLPSSKKTRNAGNGPTAFHQDFITFAVDRTGGMTFWLALEDYGPEFGTMSFVSRSDRLGVVGGYHTYGDADLLDVYSELRDLEMSAPMSYAAGDVTVHSHLTVHGAGMNLTDRPRWAYLMLVQPADVCWNGAPSEAFDTTGMELHQRLDGDRFPRLD
ncbi:phytanoyl-CoA dioxygenase family protein [Phenylobacterium sp. LjRoot225]|uniref:phytanoyl-CoA dioxygenase family protein n=1 Tax=Phenylobacterium sp. LjRoot225 TaxID=3342285 RepID=UPI003ED0D85A